MYTVLLRILCAYYVKLNVSIRVCFQVEQINYHRFIVFQLLLFCIPHASSLMKSKNKLQYCDRSPSRCVDMNHSMCLGVKLPYTTTSTDLVLDADTPEEAQVF